MRISCGDPWHRPKEKGGGNARIFVKSEPVPASEKAKKEKAGREKSKVAVLPMDGVRSERK